MGVTDLHQSTRDSVVSNWVSSSGLEGEVGLDISSLNGTVFKRNQGGSRESSGEEGDLAGRVSRAQTLAWGTPRRSKMSMGLRVSVESMGLDDIYPSLADTGQEQWKDNSFYGGFDHSGSVDEFTQPSMWIPPIVESEKNKRRNKSSCQIF
jgi:hypothetical protein